VNSLKTNFDRLSSPCQEEDPIQINSSNEASLRMHFDETNAHLRVHKFSPIRITEKSLATTEDSLVWVLHVSVVYDAHVERFFSPALTQELPQPAFISSPLMHLSLDSLESDSEHQDKNGVVVFPSTEQEGDKSPMTRDGVFLVGSPPSPSIENQGNSDSLISSSTIESRPRRTLTGSPFPSPSTSRKMAAFLSKKSERLSVIGLGVSTGPTSSLARTSSKLASAESERVAAFSSSTSSSSKQHLMSHPPPSLNNHQTPESQLFQPLASHTPNSSQPPLPDKSNFIKDSVLPHFVPQKQQNKHSLDTFTSHSKPHPLAAGGTFGFVHGEPLGLGLITTSPTSYEERPGLTTSGRSELFGSLVGSYEVTDIFIIHIHNI
jgi:hypothetical protein